MKTDYEFDFKEQTFVDWVKDDCVDRDTLAVLKTKENHIVLHNKRTNQMYLLFAELPNIIEETRDGVEL